MFLTNLPDQFHVGAFSRTNQSPYHEKATIFCDLCSGEVPMFVLAFDIDTFGSTRRTRQPTTNPIRQ
jgi:hypothetical protein